jgi:GNAT superfamily N-acetyltransferase
VKPLAAPVRLREMTTADVPAAHALSRDAGWNQTEADWTLLLQLNPGRFVAAVAGERVVGTGGAACYGHALAWVCMILVEPAWRGGGIGRTLVEGVLERVSGVGLVGLDATPAGRPVYARLGFEEAFPLVRMAAPRAAKAAAAGRAAALPDAALDVVLAMDRAVFGADRSAVLRTMSTRGGAWWVRGAVGFTAYAFLRHGEHSRHVGPVVARDVASARAVVEAALPAGDGPLLIDVPVHAEEWRAVLGELGFYEQRPLLRMLRGGASPPGDPRMQMAILGPEFG